MVSLSPHFCAVVTIAKIPIKGIPMEIISLWLHQGFLPHRVVVYRQREREHFTQADTGPQTKQGLGHYKDKPKCRSSVQKKKKKVIAANSEMGLLASNKNTSLCYSHQVILQRHVNVAAADLPCFYVLLCASAHIYVGTCGGQRLISGIFT